MCGCVRGCVCVCVCVCVRVCVCVCWVFRFFVDVDATLMEEPGYSESVTDWEQGLLEYCSDLDKQTPLIDIHYKLDSSVQSEIEAAVLGDMTVIYMSMFAIFVMLVVSVRLPGSSLAEAVSVRLPGSSLAEAGCRVRCCSAPSICCVSIPIPPLSLSLSLSLSRARSLYTCARARVLLLLPFPRSQSLVCCLTIATVLALTWAAPAFVRVHRSSSRSWTRTGTRLALRAWQHWGSLSWASDSLCIPSRG